MNTENINKLIAALQRDRQLEVSHFTMQNWARLIDMDKFLEARLDSNAYHACNTAMCLCGWANLIRLQEDAPNKTIYRISLGNTIQAGQWLDIGGMQREDLFLMREDDEPVLGMQRFDALPAEQRYNAAIKVLEILRDTGKVDWDAALTSAGIEIRGIDRLD